MTMITPSYLGETIEYSSLHACRSTLEDPTHAATTGSGPAPASPTHAARGTHPLAVSARFRGRVRQHELGPGAAVVDISLVVDDPRLRDVHIRIEGQAIAGGGVAMSDSQVSAGPASNPDRYSGHVTALAGPTIQASAADSSGATIAIAAELQFQARDGSASGMLTARTASTP